MPCQLIYTSAPRGLLSGQSGFCTVARSGDLREALAQRLEQISSYHYLRVAEAATANRNPTVCAFRILDLRGSKYYVLTRIQPCGLDFTARTNHLAHHLVFQANELPQLPSPAAILQNWSGWLSNWQGEPRILEDPPLDGFAAAAKPCLPAQTWLQVTGDAGRAAGLLESECVRGCYLVCPQGTEQQVLQMFCETLQLLNLNGQYALRPWRHSFTTFLQGEDNLADFQWRACQEGTPAYQQALQRSAPLIQLRSLRVPSNSLVKTAREGLKPPAPPTAAPALQSKLTLQAQPTGRRASASVPDFSQSNLAIKGVEKSDGRHINVSLKFTSLTRIALVIAVLAGLWAMKQWLSKRHIAHPTVTELMPIQPEPVAATTETHNTVARVQQEYLAGDGPTWVLPAVNLTAINLPVDSISPFQNLLQRFDHLDTLPADMQLSFNTNAWANPSAESMTVNGMNAHVLSAQTAGGVECSFDYSSWQNDPHAPVVVHTAFSVPPSAFSVQFSFSSSSKGDPFRLLFVNESNPPEPLHLSLPWFASNQVQLAQRLAGDYMLMGGRHWQFQPFVSLKDGQTNYLYSDWPPEDVPPLGAELDFAASKRRLSARLKPLDGKIDTVSQKLEDQIKQAGFDNPVGKDLGLANINLASFSTYSERPTVSAFFKYLNRLKKQTAIKDWPRVAEEDEDLDLSQKFERIFNLCVEKNPGAKTTLTVGSTNYFASSWQNLKDIEKVRLEKQRLQDTVDKLDGRLRLIPDTLDKTAYVGLFMIDPPKPGLEMIRFDGP